jgi:hypothetical protein
MFSYFYWHARHMFPVPSVLWLQFLNRWRYICCLLVQWLLLVRWFVGSSVVGCVFLAQAYGLGPWGCSWAFFVLSRWFGSCSFLLFASALQGWGPMLAVGFFFFFVYYYYYLGALWCSNPAPTSGHAVVLFVVSGEVEVYSTVRFCWYFNVDMIENSCMENSSRSACAIAISVLINHGL